MAQQSVRRDALPSEMQLAESHAGGQKPKHQMLSAYDQSMLTLKMSSSLRT